MAIEYGPISVKQITRNVYQATTALIRPTNTTVTMSGHSAEIAEEKLKLFLANKPYKHLDQNGGK